MKVAKLMKADVGACHPDEPGSLAAQIMWERDCGVVPVVDESSKVLGVITDRDLCIASYLEGKPVRDIAVGKVMSKEIWSCRPDDDVADAEDLMGKHQVRRLPVTDGEGHLLGMLSLSDIALEAAAETKRKAKRPQVSYTDVARTLGDISLPHQRPRTARAS